MAILAASEFSLTEVINFNTAAKPCTSVGEIPLVIGLLKKKKKDSSKFLHQEQDVEKDLLSIYDLDFLQKVDFYRD